MTLGSAPTPACANLKRSSGSLPTGFAGGGLDQSSSYSIRTPSALCPQQGANRLRDGVRAHRIALPQVVLAANNRREFVAQANPAKPSRQHAVFEAPLGNCAAQAPGHRV